MRAFLILIGVLVVIVVAIRFYPNGGGPQRLLGNTGPGQLAGAPATSFPISRIDGAPDSLAQYRGTVVLMNLWATWCTPCREEMPALDRLYRQLSRRGLVVLGIDEGESAHVVGAYARARGVTFPILLDEAQDYGRAYSALGLPTSIVIDRGGRIVKGYDGALTFAQMQEAVLPALGK
ncbi:MAG: TlpA family protein disulfide reductase [Candidatus Eremiobacteraeota bacterium]|nr:TlpA family protein disulfide reductase [Candidatus Eremiobacteraeota bacterium]